MADPAPILPADPPPGSPPPDPSPGSPPPDLPTGNAWLTENDLGDNLKSHERITGFKSVSELAQAYVDSPTARTVPIAGDYTLPENFPLEDFGEFANKAELTQSQVDQLIKYNQRTTDEKTEVYKVAMTQELNKLLDGWGDKRDHNVTLARRALRTFDTTDGQLGNFLKATSSHEHPAVVNFFHNLGKLLEETPYLKSDTMTPKQPKKASDVLYPTQGE